MIPNKQYKVKWIDINSFAEWKSKEELLKTPPMVIEAIYFYVGKGKGGLVFAGEYNDGDYGNSTIIPKSNILETKKVK